MRDPLVISGAEAPASLRATRGWGGLLDRSRRAPRPTGIPEVRPSQARRCSRERATGPSIADSSGRVEDCRGPDQHNDARAEDEHSANQLSAADQRLSGTLTRCGPGWTVAGLAHPEHGPSPPAPVGARAEQGRPRPRCPPDAGLGRLALPPERQRHVAPTGRAEPRLTRTASAQTPSTSAGLPR